MSRIREPCPIHSEITEEKGDNNESNENNEIIIASVEFT